MNKTSLISILLCCILFLFACSTKNSSTSFTPLSAEAELAVLYIYRPSVMANAMYSPDLYINDEYKLAIKNGKNTRLTLRPGDYKFELEPGGNYSGLRLISKTLDAGNTYYIRVDTSLKIESVTQYEPYQRSFNLINVDEKLAINEITKCCTTKSKTTIAEEPETLDKKSHDGFSIDKTQNPFSH